MISYEESTRVSTDASGRACAPNNCYRKKNPFTTTLYWYATTFNKNAAKNQQQSHLGYTTTTAKALHLLRLQHQKQRTITICQTWQAESVLKWNAFLCKEKYFGHAQLSQFRKTEGFHLRKGPGAAG